MAAVVDALEEEVPVGSEAVFEAVRQILEAEQTGAIVGRPAPQDDRRHLVGARLPRLDDAAHAARAFGSYQDEARYGEVVWRFSPAAAPTAREFVFHPGQSFEEQPDGSLVVRFHASGWLEMAWHLYQWGDTVEVLAPEGLRALVGGHRRSDFEALP